MNTCEIEEKLAKEISDDLEGLDGMVLNSEEYKATVNDLTKLIDRAIELKKVDVDAEDKAAKRQMDDIVRLREISLKEEQHKVELREISLKEEQLKHDKKDKVVGYIISAAGIVLPLIVTVWGTCKTLKFDQTDTITTSMGRGFINKLLPKK